MNNEKIYLLKYGEIALKKGNRHLFEKKLKENIKLAFRGKSVRVEIKSGRFFIFANDLPEKEVVDTLSSVFGLIGFAKTLTAPKEIGAISQCVEVIADENIRNIEGETFKIETRRVDKSLSMESTEYNIELGGVVLDKYPNLKVKLKNPDWAINVELRDKCYIYGPCAKGLGGLPVGTAGKGVVLLSGGIDSPVAATMMSKRGVNLTAVHFHTPPYTSNEATEKVKDLSRLISRFNPKIKLYIVNFSEIQLAINKFVPKSKTTLHSRFAMMKIAEKLAFQQGCGALITGEALSQVASQTMESLRYTGSATILPILRPLIGMDKEEIITLSQKYGYFELSIKPFDDCCALFSPNHPTIKPDFEETVKEWRNIEDIETLLQNGLKDAEVVDFFKE